MDNATLGRMSKEWESGIGERAANLQSRHLAVRRAYDARDHDLHD